MQLVVISILQFLTNHTFIINVHFLGLHSIVTRPLGGYTFIIMNIIILQPEGLHILYSYLKNILSKRVHITAVVHEQNGSGEADLAVQQEKK